MRNNDELDALQKFLQRLNADPKMESIEKTPDGKAQTVVISHIETTLDEFFFGQWSTTNFRWSQITNEVQGSLDLCVTHPITEQVITRTGAASVVITVDKVPEEIEQDRIAKNLWALSADNKKPNALHLVFPKLKAECLKNAAQSLGKIFGRDLNRKKADKYHPFKLSIADTGLKELPESTMHKIEAAISSGAEEFEIIQSLDMVSELVTDEQRERINSLLKHREL